jgi:activator of 2-hydroxyglutaryl-CoA dehydratase
MAGGVAKNSGVVKALEKVLGTSSRFTRPQIVGALGAAILALEKAA